jgi:hypothetical protein
MVAKYGTADEIIAAAGRTDLGFNLEAGAAIAGGAQGLGTKCKGGCQ